MVIALIDQHNLHPCLIGERLCRVQAAETGADNNHHFTSIRCSRMTHSSHNTPACLPNITIKCSAFKPPRYIPHLLSIKFQRQHNYELDCTRALAYHRPITSSAWSKKC